MFLLNPSKLLRTDLRSSHQYISEQLEAPKAADNLIDEAMRIIDYISETPYTRPLVNDAHLASLGIRSIKVKNYILFYNVEEDKDRVNAIRFLYNKRDWINILKESDLNEILQ
ncbi:MAG: type II toxin-antitoxin system RelE/ParE family toxin [Treponema sp.]|jgi:plasmid stabilization system protein ParE|nr:type II toxin-antitoxin system RelE/ParE family toxin [Treponema sp.]